METTQKRHPVMSYWLDDECVDIGRAYGERERAAANTPRAGGLCSQPNNTVRADLEREIQDRWNTCDDIEEYTLEELGAATDAALVAAKEAWDVGLVPQAGEYHRFALIRHRGAE